MSERDDYPAGVPCSVTNLAPDVRAAMDFYGELFGWTFDHNAEEDFAVALLRDREVAAIGSLAKSGPDVQPAWVTNVRVDSVDAAAEQSPAAGGTLLAGPMDFPPAGRLTVLADPTGATICAWEAQARRGAQIVNEPGAWAMSALQTPDPDKAAAFYAQLFGWEIEAFGDMTLFRLPGYVGGEPEQPVARDVVAAMGPPTPGPAAWTPDFWIGDAEAAAATAARHGGDVLGDVEDLGPFRRATLADPAGATFTVSQLVLAGMP